MSDSAAISGFDPAAQPNDQTIRIVLQLMKLARERQLRRFFEWLTGEILPFFNQLPDTLLKKMLLYA